MTTTRTTCPYCGVGCGVLATPQPDGSVRIQGDPEHPANYGRLCSKGAQLGETVDIEGRLLQPMVNGNPTDWEQAIPEVANQLQSIIDRHGPKSVALYVSAQLLSEDYYVANKLVKGGFGTANIDTNSRLCMSSAVAGHKRAFGSDTVPGNYEDFEQADLVILTGSNTAWCHPVLYQRIKAAKRNRPGMRVVVIDPRRTATCEIADLHLPIRNGSDAWLFNHILCVLHAQQVFDFEFIQSHTEGFDQTLQNALQIAQVEEQVSRHCGLKLDDLRTLAEWFVSTEKTVTLFSQGINQSSSGTDKINAILNCHLATGRIGRAGMGPFSMTGQPNAMGGREIGALCNQLAAHMDFDRQDVDRVQRFWDSPRIADEPGIMATDLFQAIEQGEIKALWILATNPVVSLPDSDQVKRALEAAELVIVSDCVQQNDTLKYADILLPAITWGEKSGTVTNSERCISRQRGFLDSPGVARPDWWILSQVAQNLGYSGFEYDHPHQIYCEMAALSGFENNGKRDFDISATANINAKEYDQLQPFYWPRTERNPAADKRRFFADGHFYTPSNKARFLPISPREPESSTSHEYPLVLNTGRIRDQWHTMTRSGKSAKLMRHILEPYVEMHPQDIEKFGLQNTSLVRVESVYGKVLVRLRNSQEQKPGNLFIPIHWNDQFSAKAGVCSLIAAHTDPVSGQPEYKYTAAKVSAYSANWFGFVLSRKPLPLKTDYWSLIKRDEYWQYEMAGQEPLHQVAEELHKQLIPDTAGECDTIRYQDSGTGAQRLACLIDNRLQACMILSPDNDLPDRAWINQLFNQPEIDKSERISILSGIPPIEFDSGPVVCSCFNVGQNRIEECIHAGALSPEKVGEMCEAGTNCGSCLPEIQKLIETINPA